MHYRGIQLLETDGAAGGTSVTLDWTTVITGAIGAFVLGISNGMAIVIANRYTVRFLDTLERNKKCKEKKE